MPTRPA